MCSVWPSTSFATLTVKNAQQYRADTSAIVPDPSGTIPAGVGVYFDCAPTDTTGATIQMQVELQKLPASWTGNPNYVSSYVASGSRPRTSSATGLAAGNYGWRYRVVNSAGQIGNWVAANNPDFIVQAAATLPSTSPASLPVIAQPIYTPATVSATVAVTPPSTISVNPPTINLPGSASPPGTMVNSLTPNFNWNNANGATGYGLYIRDMTAAGTPLVYPNASGITVRPVASIDFGSGPTFTLPQGILVNGHTYRWNVTSFNGSTEGSRVSSVLYFQTPPATVAVTPPPTVSVNPPVVNLPGSVSPPGTMVNSLTPNFNWNNANGATGYGLYIRDMTAAGTPLVYPNASGITVKPVASIDFGSGPTFTLPPGILVNGHTYRWNVTSFNGSTEGSRVSSVLYFQTPASQGLSSSQPTQSLPTLPVSTSSAPNSIPAITLLNQQHLTLPNSAANTQMAGSTPMLNSSALPTWLKLSNIPQALTSILADVSKTQNLPLKLETYTDTKFHGLVVGEYRITPDASVDLGGLAGTLKVLQKVDDAATIYSIYDNAKSEFESRGITGSSLVNAWVASPQSIVFAFQNPDAGIQALTEGFTSASAVSIRFASFGLVEVHGPEVEQWVNKIANVNPGLQTLPSSKTGSAQQNIVTPSLTAPSPYSPLPQVRNVPSINNLQPPAGPNMNQRNTTPGQNSMMPGVLKPSDQNSMMPGVLEPSTSK